MKGYIENLDCFGKFTHSRKPYDVENQVTVRGNRDTLYSFGVFDLKSPLTVTLPDPEGRYQSIMIVSQDHSIWGLYGPKTGTLTEEKVGTLCVPTHSNFCRSERRERHEGGAPAPGCGQY